MLNISEQISVTVPTWDWEQEWVKKLCTRRTNAPMICHCIPNVFQWYYRKKYPGRRFYDMQATKNNEDPSWRCDRVHVVSAGVAASQVKANLGQDQWKRRRWPGKSGSLPSILQRQRDVRGRWPFPANQREIRGEERTPPSTSARPVMRFPCLCWLVEAWRYLYPFWQKTGTQRLISSLCVEKRNSSVKFVYRP